MYQHGESHLAKKNKEDKEDKEEKEEKAMIEVFYNLKALPFQKDINAVDIFLSAASKELFQRLEYIKQNRGIMMITGMPGTGKTLHLRSFVQQLNPNLYKYFYQYHGLLPTIGNGIGGSGPMEKNRTLYLHPEFH
jgi:SpoVK/Ycf46/Vps4 family AAA+-type ATPase